MLEGEVSFRVPSFSIPYSDRYLTESLRLNQFQDRVYDALAKGRDILLTAPTGAGKTLSLLLDSGADSATPGFVAVYPNNTLLLNQLCTVEDILVDHFHARLVDSSGFCQSTCISGGHAAPRRCECLHKSGRPECVEALSIYEVSGGIAGSAWSGARYVALLALSGRYIPSVSGVPKREVLYGLARKILSYRRRGVYTIVFSTPDTLLLVMTGAYRDFDLVGKTVENVLLALERGESVDRVLRETGTLTRRQVDEAVSFVQRVANHPLFIDEFHLYGLYEVDALHALITLHKTLVGKPVVFSSATPAEDIIQELSDTPLHLEPVKAETTSGKGFRVRGDTLLTLIPVETRRKGLPGYYEASEAVLEVVSNRLIGELKGLRDGRALIILERLWMVATLAGRLASVGLAPECIASIVPAQHCRAGSSVIVGSEATTQGVNLGKITLGATGGTSSEDVIQRIGRVGRRGVDSRIYLVLPAYRLGQARVEGELDYWGLVELMRSLYPDYPKRKREVSRLIPRDFHDKRRKLIYTIGLISAARVSGMKSLYERITLEPEEARSLRQMVVGAGAFVKLLVFRRTGFNTGYIVRETGERGEASIGIIARNFKIHGVVGGGELVISLTPSRTPVRVKVLGNPGAYKGRFVELKTLLRSLIGRVELGEHVVLDSEVVGDVLAYVTDAGEKLSEYLSYTGEGAEILSPRGRRYALLFV